MRNNSVDIADRLVSPACRPTVDLINLSLDGDLPAAALDRDEHGRACPECRERIAASKLLASVLAIPEPGTFPVGMTKRLVSAVLADRLVEQRSRLRLRLYSIAGGIAIAAGVLLAVWLDLYKGLTNSIADAPQVAQEEPSHPATTPSQHTVSPQPPVRLGEEIARAELALVNSSRPLIEPAEVAPQVFAKLTDVLTRPTQPRPEFEPARQSLLELPEAARSGLDPITSTAQKAFSRLIHDVGGVQPRFQEN